MIYIPIAIWFSFVFIGSIIFYSKDYYNLFYKKEYERKTNISMDFNRIDIKPQIIYTRLDVKSLKTIVELDEYEARHYGERYFNEAINQLKRKFANELAESEFIIISQHHEHYNRSIIFQAELDIVIDKHKRKEYEDNNSRQRRFR